LFVRRGGKYFVGFVVLKLKTGIVDFYCFYFAVVVYEAHLVFEAVFVDFIFFDFGFYFDELGAAIFVFFILKIIPLLSLISHLRRNLLSALRLIFCYRRPFSSRINSFSFLLGRYLLLPLLLKSLLSRFEL
jgi:hypothetical protein